MFSIFKRSQSHQVRNMPDASSVIPEIISDPAGIKPKLSLAHGAGEYHDDL